MGKESASPQKRKLEDVQSPSAQQDWKKMKEEKRAQNRKWKEEKLIKKLEKKKALEAEKERASIAAQQEELLKAHRGRHYTLSIALPGSILDNAQSPELRTYLAGQIARAAVVFNVDEIIIFDETGSTDKSVEGAFDGIGKKGHANVQLARILQYLECPQYLRKSFFPQHKDLQYAGLLNPLDCPHHMRIDDCEIPYREGVVLNRPAKPGKGSFVNVGLRKECQIDKVLQDGMRVTVKIEDFETEKRTVKGKVVSPSAPRTDADVYWGYQVRLASSIASVFTESPHKDGYDLTLGTSEKGSCVDDLALDHFSHLLVVFGGLQGLEASLDSDETLKVDDPSLLFTHYLNTCPNQGSRTIRTEEAILISLGALRPKITAAFSK